jgi:hypothetical protein
MKQPQTTSIELPLGNNIKYDPRSIIPINQCKAVAILQSFEEINSAAKATRESEDLQRRNEEKQRNHEEFLKKTKERVKARKITKNEEEKDIKNKNQSNSFTFLNNQLSELPSESFNEKTGNFLEKPSEIPSPEKKITKSKSFKPKISKKPEKFPENKEKEPLNTPSVPRFINVSNMKISYNPMIIKPNPKSIEFNSSLTPSLKNSSMPSSIPHSPKTQKKQAQDRYSQALNNLVSHKLSSKPCLKSPSICTCLSSLTSKSSPHCSNCLFYQNSKDYQKALKDLLSTFKSSE